MPTSSSAMKFGARNVGLINPHISKVQNRNSNAKTSLRHTIRIIIIPLFSSVFFENGSAVFINNGVSE